MIRKWILLIVIITLFAIGFVSCHWYLNQSYSNTPDIAIRKYILKTDGPLYSYDIKITPTNIEDKHYGKQFIVEGYRYHVTGEEIRFFYLQRNRDRGWYVTSAGTGP